MTTGLGCDIGGTFTDFALVDDVSGRIEIHKCLTTPRDPSLAIDSGLAALEAARGGAIAGTDFLIHGTTLVINAVIERKGARTGLITTAGFRDVQQRRLRPPQPEGAPEWKQSHGSLMTLGTRP